MQAATAVATDDGTDGDDQPIHPCVETAPRWIQLAIAGTGGARPAIQAPNEVWARSLGFCPAIQ